MQDILQAADQAIADLDFAQIEFSLDFGKMAHKKLEERVCNYGYPVVQLATSDPHQYLFQVSNLIVEVERTTVVYTAQFGETMSRQIVGVSMYGIDGDNECEPYELGDINEFGVERVAMVKRELAFVEFRAEYVRAWMQRRDVLAA